MEGRIGQCVLRPAVLLLLISSALAQSPQADQRRTELDRFQLRNAGNAILLPVKIDDKTYMFVVDTGASATAMDITLPLGVAKRTALAGTAGDAISVSVFQTPKATVGTCDLRDTVPVVGGLDLGPLRAAAGEDIYGILGMDFLSSRVVQVNFDAQEMRFLKDANDVKAAAVDIVIDKRGVYIVLRLANSPEFALVDTGMTSFDSGNITAEACKPLLEAGKAHMIGTALAYTVSGDLREQIVQTDEVTVGSFRVSKPIFSLGKETSLGLHWLSRFNVTFDFPNKRLYLQPNKAFNKADKFNRTGLHLSRENGDTVIDSVDSNSPADKVGLKSGDVVLFVGDHNVATARLSTLHEYLCDAGPSVRVVASRAGRDFTVNVSLESPNKKN